MAPLQLASRSDAAMVQRLARYLRSKIGQETSNAIDFRRHLTIGTCDAKADQLANSCKMNDDRADIRCGECRESEMSKQVRQDESTDAIAQVDSSRKSCEISFNVASIRVGGRRSVERSAWGLNRYKHISVRAEDRVRDRSLTEFSLASFGSANAEPDLSSISPC